MTVENVQAFSFFGLSDWYLFKGEFILRTESLPSIPLEKYPLSLKMTILLCTFDQTDTDESRTYYINELLDYSSEKVYLFCYLFLLNYSS